MEMTVVEYTMLEFVDHLTGGSEEYFIWNNDVLNEICFLFNDSTYLRISYDNDNVERVLEYKEKGINYTTYHFKLYYKNGTTSEFYITGKWKESDDN